MVHGSFQILPLIIHGFFEALFSVVFTAFASWRSAVPGVLKHVGISMKRNLTPNIHEFRVQTTFLCLCAIAPGPAGFSRR